MWEKMKIVMSGIWAFLLPSFKRMMKDYGPTLLKIALKVCLSLVANQIPGAEKKEIAFKEIKQEMTSLGFQVATAEINHAIESAVIYLEDSGQKPKTITGGNI